MSDVKWIKVAADIFDNEKILMIETMPSADSIITIWFKLLTFAGKQNNEGVFLMSNRIAYTDEMLAAIFRREINVVRLALDVFKQFGMIEIIENVITIPNWNKHQSLDAYEKKKERDRQYSAERRAAQKALIEQSSDKSSDVVVSEEEKEKDSDKEIYKTIISFLNLKAGTNYRPTTPKTKAAINARLSEGFTVDDFKTVIDKKCIEWLETEFEKYLRPETLFGCKFEGYLNAKVQKRETVSANGIKIDETMNDLDDLFY